MSVEKAVYDCLSASAELISLIEAKVYAVVAPQEIKAPYITYFKVSSGRQYTHSGANKLSTPRMQVDCYGGTYEEAKDLSDLVIAALEGLPSENAKVQAVFCSDDSYAYGDVSDEYDDNVEEYHVPIDAVIHYREV